MPSSLIPTISTLGIERIHEHSLNLLEKVGIDFKTPKALEVLEKHGCPVDYERTWASLPRELVEWAVQQAPRVVRLEARDPQKSLVLDGSTSHHSTDSQGTQAIDLENGEKHDSTLIDLERGLLFADALDKIDFVNVMVSASDVPAHLRTIKHFATAFTQTSKHIRTGVLNAQQVPFLVEMVKVVTGKDSFHPIFSVTDCTISPLMHDRTMTEACIELAKLNVPIMVYPMPLAGGTSPVTLAGTVLMNNVEFLSGLVLFQAVNPGTPIIYGAGSSQLDMNTGRYGGSADGFVFGSLLSKMAEFYDVPVNVPGLSTKSHKLGAQYGYEAASATLLAAMTGADEIYSIGLLGSAQVLSLEKMVLDNHLARQIDLMLKPVVFDEAHMQADVIERVGVGGEFLTQRETLKYTREEYVPVWPPYGQDMMEVVHQEALDILHNHKPRSLPEGTQSRLETILAEADKTLDQ
jgi:trimethylamine--corrinoid protein Co-methyltransferase